MVDPASGPSAAAPSTSFEAWCEATGIHPEAVGAWEDYTSQAAA